MPINTYGSLPVADIGSTFLNAYYQAQNNGRANAADLRAAEDQARQTEQAAMQKQLDDARLAEYLRNKQEAEAKTAGAMQAWGAGTNADLYRMKEEQERQAKENTMAYNRSLMEPADTRGAANTAYQWMTDPDYARMINDGMADNPRIADSATQPFNAMPQNYESLVAAANMTGGNSPDKAVKDLSEMYRPLWYGKVKPAGMAELARSSGDMPTYEKAQDNKRQDDAAVETGRHNKAMEAAKAQAEPPLTAKQKTNEKRAAMLMKSIASAESQLAWYAAQPDKENQAVSANWRKRIQDDISLLEQYDPELAEVYRRRYPASDNTSAPRQQGAAVPIGPLGSTRTKKGYNIVVEKQ